MDMIRSAKLVCGPSTTANIRNVFENHRTAILLVAVGIHGPLCVSLARGKSRQTALGGRTVGRR